jgi:hypothetical protein
MRCAAIPVNPCLSVFNELCVSAAKNGRKILEFGFSEPVSNCATKLAPFHLQLCHSVTIGTVLQFPSPTEITKFPFVLMVF